MAEALLSSGVKMILSAVEAHVKSEIALAWGAKRELEKLQDKLVVLQLVLDDAEKRQVKEASVRHWLEKLKSIAYKAQDVMDEVSYEVNHPDNNINMTNQWIDTVLNCCSVSNPFLSDWRFDTVLNICSSSNPFLFQWKMAHMIQDINGELDKIKKEMEEYNFIKGNLPLGSYNPEDVANDHDANGDGGMESHSLGNESEIVGREAEKSRLVALLTHPASGEHERVSVLPIVGMGGLGKTTLTQLIYNDDHIKNYFKDLTMWLYVSQDFDVKRLLAKIIAKSNYGSSESTDDSNLQLLMEKLQKNLAGRRFLLVLDDVWSEDVMKWDNLLAPLLRGGAKGSKIIVTTRKYQVAEAVGTLETCQLHPLSDEDAWTLFRQRAFRSCARSEERKDLAEVGKRIMKKCGGVPLALKIMGGQLKLKGEDLDEWQFIENVDIWDLPEIKQVFKVLKVSYLALPSHLKQCFSYCSIFRKGESIKVDELVQLWMAEGFINLPASCGNTNEKKVLEEDVGRRYAKSLFNSCFFEAEEWDEWGGQVKSFKMHDLVHDLAKSVVSTIDRASVLVGGIEKGDDAERLQVASTAEGASLAMQVLGDLMSTVNCYCVRVFILRDRTIGDVSSIINLRRLRVLILTNLSIEELPESFANLKHLRYLDLSKNRDIKVLPESFTALYNLQTLKLNWCGVTQLPSDFTAKLKNFRHLEYLGLPDSTLKKMPKELSRLKFLQTWPHFKVSKDIGRQISELGPLKHLRGKLQINGLKNVEDMEAAKSANLTSKQNVRELDLIWSYRFVTDGTCCNDDHVLEGLQPHSNLRALRIKNFMGAKFPTWLNSGSKVLPNLVKVELRDLRRCESLPAFGSLPLLRSLHMYSMNSIKRIGHEFYGDARPSFPSLKKLHISYLTNLEDWVEAPIKSTTTSSSSLSSSFPVLEELVLNNSADLKSMPTLFPMLRKLDFRATRGSILTSLGTSSNLTGLTSLAISNASDLVQLPPKLLSNNKNLRHLKIERCAELQTIPTEELQCLTSLEELMIGGFSQSFGLVVPNEESSDQFLPGLQTLKLCDSKITSLPNYLECFTTIETLKIYRCPEIANLPDWLGNFSSLRQLDLFMCHKLEQLPSAEAMQRLTLLKNLKIVGCNQLARSCTADGGEEWHKITHIPYIFML